MHRRNLPALTAVAVLLLVTLVMGQQAGSQKPSTAGPGPQGPQPNDRNRELSKQERAVQVSIATVDYANRPKDSFKAGEKVRVQIVMNNTGAEPLTVNSGDTFLSDRLRLLKDQRPVLYHKRATSLIRLKDQYGGGGGHVLYTTLEPNKPAVADVIDLSDWYDQLEPGRYQLTLRHRFHWDSKQVETNTVTFDVVQ
jgi:hypothetical protein